MEQMGKVRDVLQSFSTLSGQAVSIEKTRIMFSKSVSIQLQRDIIGDSGFMETNTFDKYLGVSLIGRSPRRHDLQYLVEKVKAKLSRLKAKQLSFVSRVTLSKSVIQAVPVTPFL